jgi:hypothetical protein
VGRLFFYKKSSILYLETKEIINLFITKKQSHLTIDVKIYNAEYPPQTEWRHQRSCCVGMDGK